MNRAGTVQVCPDTSGWMARVDSWRRAGHHRRDICRVASYRYPGVAWTDVDERFEHRILPGDQTADLPPLPPVATMLPSLLDGRAGEAPWWLMGELTEDLRRAASSPLLAASLLRGADGRPGALLAARGLVTLSRLATPRGDLTVDAAWAQPLGVALRNALQGQRLVPFLDPQLFAGLAVAGIHALSLASALAPTDGDRMALSEAWVELLLATEEHDPAGDSLGDRARRLAPALAGMVQRGAP